MPVVDVEDVDRLFFKGEVFKGGFCKVDEAGDVILAAIDLAAVEIASRMASLEKVEAAALTGRRPHGVAVELTALKTFKFRDFKLKVGDLDEVVFGDDHLNRFAGTGLFSGKAGYNLSEAACFGDRRELSS